MLLIHDARELLDSFRPHDLRVFEVPDEDAFPLLVRDYRAWMETGGARAYLVYEDPEDGRLRGIVFRRANAAGAAGQMCDWCHSTGTADEIGLMTADVNDRRRVGVVVCRDLRCRERLEEAADRAGLDASQAQRRLLERIARFAREALEIGGERALG